MFKLIISLIKIAFFAIGFIIIDKIVKANEKKNGSTSTDDSDVRNTPSKTLRVKKPYPFSRWSSSNSDSSSDIIPAMASAAIISDVMSDSSSSDCSSIADSGSSSCDCSSSSSDCGSGF